MNQYTVAYLSRSGCGSAVIKASSHTDAKMKYEAKHRGSVVYKASGPEGHFEFMSYTEAGRVRDSLG
ncbi:hypothetical protein N9L71_01225 [Verrucomicrobiales bacterium]|jgi:hypothetical protein|nr:hypothetical protein [Verrucomicrobiales bacterium]